MKISAGAYDVCFEQGGIRVVRGGNRSRCKCAYKHIKKNYTVKSLLEEISLDREKLRLKLVGLVGRCVVP